jgi:hypothetical protein
MMERSHRTSISQRLGKRWLSTAKFFNNHSKGGGPTAARTAETQQEKSHVLIHMQDVVTCMAMMGIHTKC